MKKIFLAAAFFLLIPVFALAGNYDNFDDRRYERNRDFERDRQQSEYEYQRDSRDFQRRLNQWKRDGIIRDQRHAIKNRDWEDLKYHQRELEQQQLQERIMNQ